jgi:glycerophosphoryl diester phosphodiesterase
MLKLVLPAILILGLAIPVLAAPSSIRKIRKELLNPAGKYVLVTAHRGLGGISTGAREKYPENSLAAFSNSIELGVDMIEVDVQKTKDGHLVLMHDKSVDRMTDGTGAIAGLTLAEIKSLRLKVGTGGTNAPLTRFQVPTLEEALRLVKGKCLINLDKVGSMVPECMELLKRTGTVKQAVFKSGYSAERCAKDYKHLSPPVLFMPIIFHKDDWREKKVQGWAELEPYSRSLKPCAFELVFSSEEDLVISPETAQKIRSSGARIWINTLWESQAAGRSDAAGVNNPDANWGWVISRGATIIQTDEAERLLEYLRARKLHW